MFSLGEGEGPCRRSQGGDERARYQGASTLIAIASVSIIMAMYLLGVR